MLLKVGELAKRTGVTVRALHHYDSIGLLRPSGRSDGGYRLYNRDDVARLHGIQTLRSLGVPLADVAQMLDGGPDALRAILARQVGALDQAIVQAQALRERVGVMQLILAVGDQPPIDDWLASLAMMSTFEQYFSIDELKLALERWKRNEADWLPLLQALRQAMDRGVPPDSIEIQPLVQQWTDLALQWMEGDIAFLKRWHRMLRDEPGLPLPTGMNPALLAYIDQAIERRLAVMTKYLTLEEQHRLDGTLRPQWRALGERAEQLMAAGVPPQAAEARALARDWLALLDRMVRNDADVRRRLIAAYDNEPLLRAGLVFSADVRDYVRRAASA